MDSDFLDDGEREKARVGLERCEKVVFKKVSLDEQVLTMVEYLLKVEEVVLVGLAVGLDGGV